MKRSSERILTTHAGSLPRSKELTELHIRRSRGEAVDAERFAEGIEASTAYVVAQQLACGIDVGNDGEQARESFFTYVQHRMSGFGGVGSRPFMADMLAYPSFLELRLPQYQARERVDLLACPSCTAPVRYTGLEDAEGESDVFERALATAGGRFAETFMTAASPGIIVAAMEDRHYHDRHAYLTDVAGALRAEYRHIASRGLLLQIDAPDLAMERHATWAGRPLDEFLLWVDEVVDAINMALDGVPRERVRLHVCWGNYEGPHDQDVPLEAIVPHLYRANVGGLVLSMANPRHGHEYHVFERLPLPDEMVVITGVIDTTTNYVEHAAVVAERIERVAAAVGDPGRVIAGTDCGFDTSAGFGGVAEELAWQKLRALRAGADLASARVFGTVPA